MRRLQTKQKSGEENSLTASERNDVKEAKRKWRAGLEGDLNQPGVLVEELVALIRIFSGGSQISRFLDSHLHCAGCAIVSV